MERRRSCGARQMRDWNLFAGSKQFEVRQARRRYAFVSPAMDGRERGFHHACDNGSAAERIDDFFGDFVGFLFHKSSITKNVTALQEELR